MERDSSLLCRPIDSWTDTQTDRRLRDTCFVRGHLRILSREGPVADLGQVLQCAEILLDHPSLRNENGGLEVGFMEKTSISAGDFTSASLHPFDGGKEGRKDGREGGRGNSRAAEKLSCITFEHFLPED